MRAPGGFEQRVSAPVHVRMQHGMQQAPRRTWAKDQSAALRPPTQPKLLTATRGQGQVCCGSLRHAAATRNAAALNHRGLWVLVGAFSSSPAPESPEGRHCRGCWPSGRAGLSSANTQGVQAKGGRVSTCCSQATLVGVDSLERQVVQPPAKAPATASAKVHGRRRGRAPQHCAKCGFRRPIEALVIRLQGAQHEC